MAALTREAILAALIERKHDTESVEVPEWGGTVYIRKMSAADLKATGFFDAGGDPADVPIKVLAACLADENGDPLFTQDDVAALAEAKFTTVLSVFTEAARINGLSNDELEEAVAAFAPAQGSDSSSS